MNALLSAIIKFCTTKNLFYYYFYFEVWWEVETDRYIRLLKLSADIGPSEDRSKCEFELYNDKRCLTVSYTDIAGRYFTSNIGICFKNDIGIFLV